MLLTSLRCSSKRVERVLLGGSDQRDALVQSAVVIDTDLSDHQDPGGADFISMLEQWILDSHTPVIGQV